jgi:hypothetical protein
MLTLKGYWGKIYFLIFKFIIKYKLKVLTPKETRMKGTSLVGKCDKLA